MKISVITVCRNVEGTIRNTLDSFFAQDHAEKELVVVDGCSTDRTLEILAEYQGRELSLLSEPDKGIYDALNKGLRRYSGDAVGALNADDAFHDPFVLSRIAEALAVNETAFGNLDFVNNHAEKKVVRKWRGSKWPAKGFRSGWMPAHPTFYARREIVEKVGLFDPSYKIAADYDWMLRVLEFHARSSTHIDAVLVDMMVGGVSTANFKSSITIATECLRSRQKWLDSGIVDWALFAKPLRQSLQLVVPR